MTLTERKEVVESKMDDRGCFTPVWTFKSLSLCFRKNQSQSSCATAFQLPEFYFSSAPCSFLQSHFSVSSLWALMICLSKHTYKHPWDIIMHFPFSYHPLHLHACDSAWVSPSTVGSMRSLESSSIAWKYLSNISQVLLFVWLLEK